MENNEYLTKEKHAELKKELDELRTMKTVQIAESLEYAKQLGDLAENAEYHEARGAQAALEDRIRRLEAMLASAEIVSHKSGLHKDGETVMVGSKVSLLCN